MDRNHVHLYIPQVARIRVTHGVFDELLARQRARGYEDDVTKSHDAVWLHTDMGPSWYFARDGRVLVSDAFEEKPLHEVEGPEAFAGLVLGAKTIESPELLAMLPPKPPEARMCPRCEGSRWWTLPVPDVEGKTHQILCPDCAGLGWVEAAGKQGAT